MKLNQITVGSSDIDRSIEFYKKLGLTLIVYAPPRYARFLCPDGSTFSVHKVEKISTGSTIIYFEYDNLEEEVMQLIDKGIKFDQLPVVQPWLWREAHLSDPDGNQLILYFAGENRINPPWRIK